MKEKKRTMTHIHEKYRIFVVNHYSVAACGMPPYQDQLSLCISMHSIFYSFNIAPYDTFNVVLLMTYPIPILTINYSAKKATVRRVKYPKRRSIHAPDTCIYSQHTGKQMHLFLIEPLYFFFVYSMNIN